MSAASATSTLPPLTVRLLASSNPPAPNPEADTSAAIALAVSSTLNSTSAVNPAKSPPILALTTELPVPSLTVIVVASVKCPAGSTPSICAIKPAALSTTSKPTSAVNAESAAPSAALTFVPVSGASTVTLATPLTFRTLSPAEISAAAVSSMS